MLSCILPRWLIDMVRTSSTELLTFHWTPSVPEHAPWGTYTSKQLEAAAVYAVYVWESVIWCVHRCKGDEKHWKNTMITPYQFVLHLAQQAEKKPAEVHAQVCWHGDWSISGPLTTWIRSSTTRRLSANIEPCISMKHNSTQSVLDDLQGIIARSKYSLGIYLQQIISMSMCQPCKDQRLKPSQI